MLCIRVVLWAIFECSGDKQHGTVRAQLTSSLEIFQILISTEGRIVTVLENSCYGILNEREGREEMGEGERGEMKFVCMMTTRDRGTRNVWIALLI